MCEMDILEKINTMFKERHEKVNTALSNLLCGGGFNITRITSLEGLIFESVIHDLTKSEVEKKLKLPIMIKTQQKITGRAKSDLLIDNLIHIEIKRSGIYSYDLSKTYDKYHDHIISNSQKYLLLNWRESGDKFVKTYQATWKDHAFTLNRGKHDDTFEKLQHFPREWDRYIDTIVNMLS